MSEDVAATDAAINPAEAEKVNTAAVETTTTAAEGAKTEEQIKAEQIAKSKEGTDPEIQKKIDKLVWEKNEAKREADKIKAELESIKNKPVDLYPPDPAHFKDGEFDPGYKQALIEYGKKSGETETTARMRQELSAAAERQRQETAINTFEDRASKMRAETPDFDVVAKSPEMLQLYSHPQMQPIVDALHDSEVGPQISYYLGKNPNEAYRLANLPWSVALREIGRLEARILVDAKPKKISAAADPINPVEGSGGAVAEKDPADMSPAEFAKWRKTFVSKRR